MTVSDAHTQRKVQLESPATIEEVKKIIPHAFMIFCFLLQIALTLLAQSPAMLPYNTPPSTLDGMFKVGFLAGKASNPALPANVPFFEECRLYAVHDVSFFCRRRCRFGENLVWNMDREYPRTGWSLRLLYREASRGARLNRARDTSFKAIDCKIAETPTARRRCRLYRAVK